MFHKNYSLKSTAKLPKLSSFYLLAFCLLIMGCKDEKSSTNKVQSKTADMKKSTKEEKSDKKVILFYGDSITAGYGLDEDDSFPSLIEDKIDSLELDYTVVNAGLSGETTSGGLKRIDWVMKQKVDIFFLELGANDMLRGLPLEETRKNLSEIISIVKAKNPNIKIALCEMWAPPNMGEKYTSSFIKIYKDLAAPADIQFVPFLLDGVAGHKDLLLPDGLHPNTKGQVIVAENIWRTLKGML